MMTFGFQRLDEATREVMGESKPYSIICGSLPLVGEPTES